MPRKAKKTRSASRLPWTQAEELALRSMWADCSALTIRKHIPGRTWAALRQKAFYLGLSFGIPQGWLSVTAAAKRAGYPYLAFLRVLKRHGVEPEHHTSPLRPSAYRYTRKVGGRKRTKGFHWRMVQWDDVTAALEAERRLHETTETIAQAAQRYGLSRVHTRKLLVAAGAVTPAPRESREPHRVPITTVDAVLSARVSSRRAA